MRLFLNVNDCNVMLILSELKRIFESRYCTKDEIKIFLRNALKTISESYNYTSLPKFLADFANHSTDRFGLYTFHIVRFKEPAFVFFDYSQGK